MIINSKFATEHEALEPFIPYAVMELWANKDFQFHLTGSRLFGAGADNSDWDFFVGVSIGLATWLQENYWYVEAEPNYTGDPSVIAIYAKVGVHIQIVKDVNKKLKAQQLISTTFRGFNGLTKRQRGMVWRTLMAALEDK